MAEAIGSKELEKALKDISSGDLKKVALGIGVAAGIESESIKFYSRQAEKFRGGQEEHFFKFLAKQEEEHLQTLNSLKASLEKEGKWIEVKLSDMKKPEIFPKRDWDKEKGEGITAVLFALWKEKQAREFYEGIAKGIKEKGAREFFLALAEFEKGHAEMLEEYVEESYYTHELIMG